MPSEFDKYAAKANELLHILAEDLQVTQDKAFRILRAVLHAIRRHLEIHESLQLLAQLPMMIKAVYVDQWHIGGEFKRIHHLNQFLDEVRACDKGLAGFDFGNDANAMKAVRAVFRSLQYYLSEGEFNDLLAVMPQDVKKFIADSIGKGRMAM
ncbi:MAG TPA: DUF2267 domain-containing protein [Chitinophagaceae bacterium]|nr:DUF2267 domain-containing protein [Chitinophagaceae bacterium]